MVCSNLKGWISIRRSRVNQIKNKAHYNEGPKRKQKHRPFISPLSPLSPPLPFFFLPRLTRCSNESETLATNLDHRAMVLIERVVEPDNDSCLIESVDSVGMGRGSYERHEALIPVLDPLWHLIAWFYEVHLLIHSSTVCWIAVFFMFGNDDLYCAYVLLPIRGKLFLQLGRLFWIFVAASCGHIYMVFENTVMGPR